MRGKDAIVLGFCGVAAATGAGVWVISGGGEVAAPAESVVAMGAPEEAEPVLIDRTAGESRVRPPRVLEPVAEAEPAPRPEPEAGEEGERRERGPRNREEFMKRFDTDGDGELSDEEREAVRREYGDRRRGDEQMREIVMRRFDADGDGELNDAERDAVRAEFRRVREEIQARIMPQYDLDGDGELNREERQAAMPAYRAEFERMRAFAVLDEDGSGDINPAELAKAISAVGEGSELMDLNRDGQIDFEDATYATQVATEGD